MSSTLLITKIKIHHNEKKKITKNAMNSVLVLDS